MIELRWVYHNFSDGTPPNSGAICIDPDARLYQKLQYRVTHGLGSGEDASVIYATEWQDVPHHGREENQ